MDKDFLLKLTNNLYRLTLLFPKKEPLRYKIREVADDILVDSLRIIYPVRNQEFSNEANQYEFTNKNDPSKKCNEERARYIEDVEENLEILDSFFEVAKVQNWVSAFDVMAIQKEYDKIKKELEDLEKVERVKETEVEKLVDIRERPEYRPEITQVTPRQVSSSGVNERQQKILAFLREKGKVQVWQVKQIFPEVSKRTLRRDFENLLNQGLIERIGERNETYYTLHPSEAKPSEG